MQKQVCYWCMEK